MNLNNITTAQIFNEGDDKRTIEIIYYDGTQKSIRASSGYDAMQFIKRKKDEDINIFLNRVKKIAWEKYLKPRLPEPEVL